MRVPGKPFRRLLGLSVLGISQNLQGADDPGRIQGSAAIVSEGRRDVTPSGLFNPNHTIFPATQSALETSVRLDGSFGVRGFRLDVRPRLVTAWHHPSDRPWSRKGPNIKWPHAAAAWSWDGGEVSYGVENFQWGPGELSSPSQGFASETALNRRGFYEPEGRYQGRILVQASDTFTVTVIGRPKGSFLKHAQENQEILIKPELKSLQGEWHFGLVASASARQEPAWGGYGQIEVWDGGFFYGDTLWQPGAGKRGWQSGFVQAQDRRTLVGIRHNFLGGNDLRLEYLEQTAAPNRGLWRDWRDRLGEALESSKDPADNAGQLGALQNVLARSWDLGTLTIPLAQAIYVSCRIPEIYRGRLNVSGRWLYAVTDPSHSMGVIIDDYVGDHFQWQVETYRALGAPNRALTRSFSQSTSLGLRWAF